VLLFLALLVYPVQEFHVTGNYIMSVDQVGYITTARWLAETGELRSHLIFPAHLDDPRWRLYMPGIYYVLAANHVLLGPGPVAWRVPAMVSFVVSAVLVFLIGLRTYGRREGLVAAGLFMLFPPMAAFAFTAMPQLPFVAVCAVAFCAFVYLPARLQVYLVPALLVPPFLFRETGALLVIPMALVLAGRRGQRPWTVLLAIAGSVSVLYLVLQWQLALGKGMLPVFGGINYANAFPAPAPPLTVDNLWRNVAATVSSNIDVLRRHGARQGVIQPLEVILIMTLLALGRGLVRTSRGLRDTLPIGAGLLAVVVATMLTTLHTWSFYRGLRSMLFTFPLLAVCVAPLVTAWAAWLERRFPFRRTAVVVGLACAAGLLLVGAGWSKEHLRPHFGTEKGKQTVALLESLGLADDGVLVAPWDVSRDYALRRYPQRLSFVPSNTRTLRLLAATHPVRTVIVGTNTRAGNSPRYLGTIREMGLVQTRELPYPGRPGARLLVFEPRE
jgi:hypothetical protein